MWWKFKKAFIGFRYSLFIICGKDIFTLKEFIEKSKNKDSARKYIIEQKYQISKFSPMFIELFSKNSQRLFNGYSYQENTRFLKCEGNDDMRMRQNHSIVLNDRISVCKSHEWVQEKTYYYIQYSGKSTIQELPLTFSEKQVLTEFYSYCAYNKEKFKEFSIRHTMNTPSAWR